MDTARSEGKRTNAALGSAAGGVDPQLLSARKEPAPIIINKDEQFTYKAPSAIHETVVHTLRREKDTLSAALSNQRESTNAMAARMTQMGVGMAELEKHNDDLLAVQAQDKNALLQLDSQYQRAMDEVRELRAQIAEERLQVHRARDGQTQAVQDAETAAQEAAHSREDVSFLTKEAQRLAAEVKDKIDHNLHLEDQLARTRMELAEARNEEKARIDGMRRELESQGRLQELGAKEVDELRRRADDLHREKTELIA